MPVSDAECSHDEHGPFAVVQLFKDRHANPSASMLPVVLDRRFDFLTGKPALTKNMLKLLSKTSRQKTVRSLIPVYLFWFICGLTPPRSLIVSRDAAHRQFRGARAKPGISFAQAVAYRKHDAQSYPSFQAFLPSAAGHNWRDNGSNRQHPRQTSCRRSLRRRSSRLSRRLPVH